jgi:hypothetical protein
MIYATNNYIFGIFNNILTQVYFNSLNGVKLSRTSSPNVFD